MSDCLIGRRLLLGGAFATMTGGLMAQSDTYPSRPITLIVPFPPGGPTDASARLFAKVMAEHLAQPIVIDNRAGAGGTTGSSLAARAPADGYTLLWGGTSTLAAAPQLYKSLKYDARSFVPIGMALRSPLMLAGAPPLGARDLAELLSLAKRRSLTVGTAGIGSLGHLAMEYLCERAGLAYTHVPYRGGGPAVTDALSGQIDLVFDTASALAPHVLAGKLRSYAVTGDRPFQPLPEIPLMSALVPGYQAYAWFGPVAPAGVPPSVLGKLTAAMAMAAASPGVQRELALMGVEPGVTSAREFGEVIQRDATIWAGVIRRAGVSAED